MYFRVLSITKSFDLPKEAISSTEASGGTSYVHLTRPNGQSVNQSLSTVAINADEDSKRVSGLSAGLQWPRTYPHPSDRSKGSSFSPTIRLSGGL